MQSLLFIVLGIVIGGLAALAALRGRMVTLQRELAHERDGSGERLAQLRATRNSTAADAAIEALAAAAREDRNVIPAMLDCARAYCTLHEIRQTLEQIYGSYREPVFF